MTDNTTDIPSPKITAPPETPSGDCGAMPLLATIYQPESWSMLKDSIYAASSALRIGIENTQELLADHDQKYGRDHRSNRITAERMEREIKEMQDALDGLKKPNGCSYSSSANPDNYAIDNEQP